MDKNVKNIMVPELVFTIYNERGFSSDLYHSISHNNTRYYVSIEVYEMFGKNITLEEFIGKI